MALDFTILGPPGRDNVVYVTIDTGQRVVRMLLDCGEGCLRELPQSDVCAIDLVLFSHLHMDHVGDFEYLFRRTYAREEKPLRIWGPAATNEILHHRFRGFMWNLLEPTAPGEIVVTDVTEEEVHNTKTKIEESGANILWVGLGAPKQELWMQEQSNRINVPLMLGVGAAFDYLVGNQKWAPVWMRKLGLEWLYRMSTGESRLFKRYIKYVPLCCYHLIKETIIKRQ